MTNIDHYSKAEELLERYYQDVPLSRNANYLIEAQVHATLATVQRSQMEYVIEVDDQPKNKYEYDRPIDPRKDFGRHLIDELTFKQAQSDLH